MARDPYQELGVSRSASADEIRKAFRKLAKQHHPDTNPGNKAAEERFKQVSAAFDILGDVEKRKKFDAGEIDADGRETMRGFGGGPFGQQGSPWGAQGRQSETMEGADLSDLFSEILGRRSGGGGGGGFGGFSQRGSDVRAKLEIELEEAIHGAKRRIAFSDGRTIDVTIPKGAEEGQTLRLKGQGSPGRGGPGDAFIELVMRPHPIFRREGDALVMDLPVSIPDAVLGGKVEARTPDGAVTLTVPKGANSGQSLRLKGKGLSDSRGKRGDLLARIVLMLPEKADHELETFAERWRKERPYTPKKK
ncbi:molecular chaperone DnaJ [Phenylobacterium sp. Root77]|uniref:DnaJ C-terminal domain-containing protein n=1 Tax=unclassified Phenylobacterium TaxID=2640670 RepID=UPI0007012F09|nr:MULTISPECIES: J domain-containing protein [unclassified Phenylobacterium]KQW72890.1 molecular chaperone DnaJ [Phenylobacterium sp. Root1277]KQW92108.1 molecular chaperone DnaJ [Phenylobacterium sp. Root1290]KRC40339.1 molecular chaperone DnaJ [Phenylobacterium sp. Root77]